MGRDVEKDGRLPQAYLPPVNYYEDGFQNVESAFF